MPPTIIKTRSHLTTPHTPQEYHAYCIIAPQVHGQPDNGQYTGPKYVVVPNVIVYYSLKIVLCYDYMYNT